MRRIRVLVVDDSALMRKMLPIILATDPDIDVVGTAMDGLFALQKIRDLKPDVVTLDLDMPRMDGIETLRHIISDFDAEVIVVSSVARHNAELTIEALEIGAFDFVTKPQDSISMRISEVAAELIGKIRGAFERRSAAGRTPYVQPAAVKPVPLPPAAASDRVVCIGTSTGGPQALSLVLPMLPKNFPAGIVIVQHMPPLFTETLAVRLNSLCQIEVKEAQHGDLIQPGRALIAPGNRHMKVRKTPSMPLALLSDAPPENGHRPSVDMLFRSAAVEYGRKAVGILMTGMGADGAKGLGEIMAAGGTTIAQDEASSAVYGMPKAAADKGYAGHVLPLSEIAEFLVKKLISKECAYGTVRC